MNEPAPSVPARAPYAVGNFHKGTARHDLAKHWMSRPADERFLSLPDLHHRVATRAERMSQATVSTRKFRVTAPEVTEASHLHELMVELPAALGATHVTPTHWAFGQLCKAAHAPRDYLRTLPSPLVADALHYGLRYNRPDHEVKLYHDGEQLMAATGPDYGRIFDREVVEAVMNVAGNGLGDTRWKVPGVLDWQTGLYNPEAPVTLDTTTLYASDRDAFIFLVDDRNPIEVGKLPNGDPDLMFRGFYTKNSEVGAGSFALAAFYLRGICCNRIMWGVEHFQELRMPHRKHAPSRFIEQARPALVSFADGETSTLVEGVQRAKAAKIASDDDGVITFLTNRNFSRKRALAILEIVERDEGRPARSAWDIAQGITANAKDEANTDKRLELELEAKRLLDKAAA